MIFFLETSDNLAITSKSWNVGGAFESDKQVTCWKASTNSQRRTLDNPNARTKLTIVYSVQCENYNSMPLQISLKWTGTELHTEQ